MIPAKVRRTDRILILAVLCSIGAAMISIFSIVQLPASLVICLIAILVLCFYKVPTMTRDKNNSHEKGIYEQFDAVRHYPHVDATCNGDYVEAEIIDDGKSAYRWYRS
jgi:hypothetical protein